MNNKPPTRALAFLRWFCREEYLSEIEGDLLELFYERSNNVRPSRARLLFWWDVIRTFRPINFKKITVHSISNGMYKNYLITSLRNFSRHRSSFLINVAGLSTGLACSMLILLWIQDEFRFDRFYPKANEMYKVLAHYGYSEKVSTGEWLPGPLAAALREGYSEIASATVTTWNEEHLVSHDETHIKATGKFADEDFLEVFQRPLMEGSIAGSLNAPNAMAISASLAKRLFGDEKALGKEVRFNLDHPFMVTAVYEDFPAHSSIQVEWVVPFTFFENSNPWVKNWGNGGPQTYVRLTAGASPDVVSEKIRYELRRRNNDETTELFLYPFADYYLYGKFENGQQAGGRIEYVRLFGIIAAFILAIACINFMNLATARASRRAKEIGIRKAIGARRAYLIGQFFSESLLITLFSVCLSVLMITLALPYFMDITGRQITFSLSDSSIYLYLFAAAVATSILAGSYPALYLSSFNAVKVLKGTFTGSKSEIVARKGLVVFQFTLSIVLIIATTVIYKQIQYIQAKNLGYDKENLISFVADEEFLKKEKLFGEKVRVLPGVISVSGSNHQMTRLSSNTGNVQWEGKAEDNMISFETLRTNYDFVKTLGIEIIDGRDFSRHLATDTAKIIVNEAAAKVMGLTDPVGRKIRVWGQDWEIIGVAKDFHFASVHTDITPLLMMLEPGISYYYWIRLDKHNPAAALTEISAIYKELVPEYPFEYHFFDQSIEKLYESEQRIGKLSAYFSLFAILISTLGLFGLSAYMAEKRTKEIGIRKILGASITQIVSLLTRDFTWLVLIATAVAVPIGWYAMTWWLEPFEFKIRLNAAYFLAAGGLALLVALSTVSFQSFKAAATNPARSLRNNE